MPSLPSGAMMHLECPTCCWQKAVLVFEQEGVGTAFCPHCQHMWELAVPARPVRVTTRKNVPRAVAAGERRSRR